MAELKYTITIEEVKIDANLNDVEYYAKNIPHHDEIKSTVERIWDDIESVVIDTIEGKAAGNIESCKLKVSKNKEGSTVGTITVTPKKGFRWSNVSREDVWDALDAQMDDGFGESINRHPIDGISNEYRIYF